MGNSIVRTTRNSGRRLRCRRTRLSFVDWYSRDEYPRELGVVLFQHTMLGIRQLTGDRYELFYRIVQLDTGRVA